MSTPPLLVLGVSRSGTTLFRVILDRHPDLAVPDESYFIPQLADRHGTTIRLADFVDDLRRLPTLPKWGISAADVEPLLRPGMRLGDAIAAVYETVAQSQGKKRWGDKTPMYMQHLALLERLFPTALYVHLIRDGRDAALGFLSMPPGVVTESWALPRTAGRFACLWRTDVLAARALGARVGERYLEVRYEDLVQDPRTTVQGVCEFTGLAFDPHMLEYAGEVDVSAKPHHQRLTQAPTPGARDWRRDMSAEDRVAFEAVAGNLLAELGYETTAPPSTSDRLRARKDLASYAVQAAAWRAAGRAVRRSPLWKRRHPLLA